jgi:galactokinase
LFGEHQDYLSLPVITAAIDRRITITGKQKSDRTFFIDLPDIGSSESFILPEPGEELDYVRERDYFRSVVNVLSRRGIPIHNGYNCVVKGNIPINSGTSSSSALTIAWTQFLILAADQLTPYSASEVAHLAYLSEVVEFGEPGGMMDHYTTAMGGTNFIEFSDKVIVTKLNSELGTFVLGDSGQAKDTKTILGRVKYGVLDAVALIQKQDARFSLKTFTDQELKIYQSLLSSSQVPVLEGAMLNRDITKEARNLFKASSFQHEEFGRLLNWHHEILDKKLEISTKKINKMLINAIKAGALGGKINGSGGGGCMFAYAPEQPERVATAIRDAGGISYIITVDDGIKFH